MSFHEDRTGVFWIIYASGNGLATFDRATNTLTRYSFAEGDPIGPADPGFYSLLEDRDGTMWFGTGGAGPEADTGTSLRFEPSRRFWRWASGTPISD